MSPSPVLRETADLLGADYGAIGSHFTRAVDVIDRRDQSAKKRPKKPLHTRANSFNSSWEEYTPIVAQKIDSLPEYTSMKSTRTACLIETFRNDTI